MELLAVELRAAGGLVRLTVHPNGTIEPNRAVPAAMTDGEITEILRSAYSATGKALEAWLRSMS